MKKNLISITFLCHILIALLFMVQCKNNNIKNVPPDVKPSDCKIEVLVGKGSKEDTAKRSIVMYYRCNEIIVRGNPKLVKWLEDTGFQIVKGCACNTEMVLMRSVGVDPVGIVENPPAGTKDSSMTLNYVFPQEPFDNFKFEKSDPVDTSITNKGKSAPTTKVAIIDTGIDTDHPALAPYLWTNTLETNGCPGFPFAKYGLDMTNFLLPEPEDQNGHGTHVSGIVAGQTPGAGDNEGIRIELISVKITDSNTGQTDLFTATCGMHYALRQGAKVLNCSWGYLAPFNKGKTGQGAPGIMLDVLKEAKVNNAVIVAAIGNNHMKLDENLKFWPACFAQSWDNVISVAAWDENNHSISSMSNWGDNSIMDVMAPGVEVLSTYMSGSPTNPIYARGTGTSMAAPFVSRAVAIMMQTKRSAITNIGEIKARVKSPDGQTNGVLTHATAILAW